MINVILCACAAWVLVYKIGLIRFKYKPLNCETCMAGWIACVYCWDDWYTPLNMAGAMIAVIIINKIVSK